MQLYNTIYTFYDVKRLFDEFNIKKSTDGAFQVVKRSNGITYGNQALVDNVKFAHTWVAATEFGRSRMTPDTQVITQEDYSFAFDEEARRIYDFIMDAASQELINNGVLIGKEQLVAIIKTAVLRAHAKDVVEGLYSDKRFLEAFNKWVRACNNMPTEEGSLKQAVQGEAPTH